MIQVGQSVYFENAPWLLTTQGATAPQPYVIPTALVPVEAVRYYLQTIVMRAWADVNGNIDVSTVLRLPGFLTTNYALLGTIAASRLATGGALEIGGQVVPVPNLSNTFYWFMQGNTLNAGVDITVALLGYDLPAAAGGSGTQTTSPDQLLVTIPNGDRYRWPATRVVP